MLYWLLNLNIICSTDVPGALLAGPNRVSLIRETITLNVSLENVSNTYRVLKACKEVIKPLRDELSNFRLHPTVDDANTNSLKTQWSWRIQNTENILKEIVYATDEKPQDGNASRKKRGLFNIVGQAQSWLFGTATSSEVAEVRKGMEALNQEQLKQSKIINGLSSLFVTHNELLQNIVGTVNNLTDHVSLMTEMINNVNSGLVISNLIDSLHSQVVFYATHFNLIVENIYMLEQNIVTPDFLHMAELRRVVNYGMEKYDFIMALPLHDLASYYNLLQVSMFGGSIYIHVPFVGPENYNLINIIPFPFNIKHDIHKSVVLEKTPDFILYNQNTTDIAFPTLMDLAKCKKPLWDNLICPADFVTFRNEQENSCLQALVRVDVSAVSAKCSFQQINVTSLWLEKVGKRQYVYSPTRINAILHCPPSPPKPLTIQGRFSFEQHCTFSGKDTKVLGVRDHMGGYIHRKVQPYAHINTQINSTVIPPANIKHLPEVEKHELEDIMKNYDFIPYQYASHVSISSLALGGVCLLIIIGITIFYCKLRRNVRSIVIPQPELDIKCVADAVIPHVVAASKRIQVQNE